MHEVKNMNAPCVSIYLSTCFICETAVPISIQFGIGGGHKGRYHWFLCCWLLVTYSSYFTWHTNWTS